MPDAASPVPEREPPGLHNLDRTTRSAYRRHPGRTPATVPLLTPDTRKLSNPQQDDNLEAALGSDSPHERHRHDQRPRLRWEPCINPDNQPMPIDSLPHEGSQTGSEAR